MSALDQIVLSTLPLIPTPIMRRLAGRYIAGERLDEAIARLQGLASEGHAGVIDLLGEDVRDEAQARKVLHSYTAAADAVHAARLDAYVSVKPTHVGLELSEDLAFDIYHQLAGHCAGLGQFLRVEMEDHATTERTLRVFERLRREHHNVGIVLQSRLLRTPVDIEALAPGPLDVRMVKGIYLEPAEIAHTAPGAIRDAYLACTAQLFDRGATVSLATHDEVMAADLIKLVTERGLGTDRYEFQVLLGVREPLWKLWKDDGHRVRVYVPYGPEWRAYSQRRLRKNPQLFRHVVRDTLRFWS
ncbi:proline dehydrogenase family protein [Engelhardtia mirabilis]|uniref:proline dehydrogenase n=1 Tax=Engelhardtia mirabilis TaxID=2528011 RepID=A0A518BP69_9BACT|nr:Proline dehydrogenase 1 [Planctomycetes bacterium Pla133]QDV03095.1 Proline dehydrogenase 1 [Planctomycetes bacterium Pla86]